MRTSVRRGTDKTGPTNARLQKSVDNYLSTRRVGVDVVAILVISPGLEARRTRLTPRPPGEAASIGQETLRRSTPGLSIRWSRCRGAIATSLETPLADRRPHQPPSWNQRRCKRSRGSPHAARTSTIGGGKGDNRSENAPSFYSGLFHPMDEASRPRSPTGPHHPPNRTSTGTSGLEARRTRLAPRPSRGGASVG